MLKSHWVSPGRWDQHRGINVSGWQRGRLSWRGADAIENRIRKEKCGEKELSQLGGFDLIQNGRGKPAEWLLEDREEDWSSHALHRI